MIFYLFKVNEPCSSLITLDLSDNNLENAGFLSLLQFCGKFTPKLEVLGINNINISLDKGEMEQASNLLVHLVEQNPNIRIELGYNVVDTQLLTSLLLNSNGCSIDVYI